MLSVLQSGEFVAYHGAFWSFAPGSLSDSVYQCLPLPADIVCKCRFSLRNNTDHWVSLSFELPAPAQNPTRYRYPAPLGKVALDTYTATPLVPGTKYLEPLFPVPMRRF